MTTLEDEIRRDLTAAVLAGDTPDGPAGRMLAEKHRRWLSASWEQPIPLRPCGAGSAVHAGQNASPITMIKAVPGCAAIPAPRCRSVYRPLGVK